jgi:hypothetical protein
MIEGMGHAIIGIDSTGKRVIYSVDNMINIAMKDQGISFDEATDLIIDEVVNATEEKDNMPIYLFEFDVHHNDMYTNDQSFIGSEPRQVRDRIKDALDAALKDGKHSNDTLVNVVYQATMEERDIMIRDIKAKVMEILDDAEGVDVMLDIINLLKSLD